jgi:hypothetical protein
VTAKTRPVNVCNGCLVLDATPCPILERAYRIGYEGMSECEMKSVIFKVVEKEKYKAGFGPKNRPGRKVKDGEEV